MKNTRKITRKHLALSKETVRELLSHELTQVAGGIVTQQAGVCPFSRQLGCTTSCPQ